KQLGASNHKAKTQAQLIYGAEILSLFMNDALEIVQNKFLRKLLAVPQCPCPPRSQTPLDVLRASEIESHASGEKNSSQSEEDFIERRREIERLLKKNSDWIWDWSSRPENIPPNLKKQNKTKTSGEFLFKHPKRTATLSMRNTSVMKKGGIFSAEFLKVFLPSLLLSHLLAIGLG
uniref:BCL2 interacting protein 3 n=1 Tax=Sphenodon punctatus TaxID=8508 RepID=A0A8D0GKE6_SPHPU